MEEVVDPALKQRHLRPVVGRRAREVGREERREQRDERATERVVGEQRGLVPVDKVPPHVDARGRPDDRRLGAARGGGGGGGAGGGGWAARPPRERVRESSLEHVAAARGRGEREKKRLKRMARQRSTDRHKRQNPRASLLAFRHRSLRSCRRGASQSNVGIEPSNSSDAGLTSDNNAYGIRRITREQIISRPNA